ncbi:hypothetical protein LTR37_005051 [Vermiconidia calcicola]|uniref:Uncharacterized protein n=1 Tax=Vermiconidia calcicola TaxID=1690605 RepID=A0ACC3NK87_9PEZI|nr:hypothetical protein LTR37_005051 [Vermiconidia calcicola]
MSSHPNADSDEGSFAERFPQNALDPQLLFVPAPTPTPEAAIASAPSTPPPAIILPPNAIASWNCRDLIFAVQQRRSRPVSYEAVLICAIVLSANLSRQNLVFVLSASTPGRWRIPNDYCNRGTGCVDDKTSLAEHAMGLATLHLDLNQEDFESVELTAVFEDEIGGSPILVAGVRLDIPEQARSVQEMKEGGKGVNEWVRMNMPEQARSMQEMKELIRDAEGWARAQVEASRFEPEVTKWCVLAAFDAVDRERPGDAAPPHGGGRPQHESSS